MSKSKLAVISNGTATASAFVRVPNSLTVTLGVTKLRETLATTDPMEAEREKVEKAKLRGEKVSVVQSPLADEAMGWREAIQQAAIGQGNNEPDVVRSALSDRVQPSANPARD